MLAIGTKLDDPQIISTALQNQATVAFQHGEIERWLDLSTRALETKLALGDKRGASEIPESRERTRRGWLDGLCAPGT